MTDRMSDHALAQDIGRLQGDVAAMRTDLIYIRTNMVTRLEFDSTAREHAGFRTDIDTLKDSSAKQAPLWAWLEKIFWCVIAGGTAAALNLKLDM